MEKVPPPPYAESVSPPGFVQQTDNFPPHMQPGYAVPPSQPGYAVPPSQYAGPMPPNQHQVVMIASSPPVIYGPNSIPMTCPHCHNQITTRVESESSSKTHLFAVLLCIVGCIPCCLIPYCTDSCQNRNHYCPSCGAFLGFYTN
ncbi:hypothetical protein FQA39_LY05780 [Lamprigera yunnana]|nr:hypothetical protein FQA39_LY05780 [Lamprigera yunnana]